MKDTGQGPTVFRDGLRSGATENWVRWAVERGGGGDVKGKVGPMFHSTCVR